jgi:hypothetical protein
VWLMSLTVLSEGFGGALAQRLGAMLGQIGRLTLP